METSSGISRVLNDKKAVTAILLVIFVIVTIYTQITNTWNDLNNYYRNAGDVLNGLMPYSETVFEYPPLALIFMVIPRIFSWDLTSYHYVSALQALVFILIGAAVTHRISDEFIGDRRRGSVIFLCLFLFGTYFLIARNDIYAAVLTLIGLYLYLKKKYIPAFVIISLAAMIKLYPAIFLIAMIIPILTERKWKLACLVTILSLLVCIIVELPFLIKDPSTAFAYLTYHSDRGLQIESVASGFIMLWGLFFPTDVTHVFSYGSDNIVGTVPDMLALWMNIIMAAALMIFVAVMFIRILRSERAKQKIVPLAALMSVTMITIFIIFSKVYSAQYYIWIVSILIFSQLKCFNKIRRDEIIALLIPFGISTILSYSAYVILDITTFNPVAVTLVVIKNIFTLLLAWELIRLCICETDNEEHEQKKSRFTSFFESLIHARC